VVEPAPCQGPALQEIGAGLAPCVGIPGFLTTETKSAIVNFAFPQLRQFGHLHRGHIGINIQTVTPSLAQLGRRSRAFQRLGIGALAGLAVSSWKAFKDPPWEGFLIASIGMERVGVELYKTFLKRHVRGIHADQPV